MESIIRDINLAESGSRKIEWARKNMPLLKGIEEEFKKTKPFSGLRIALSIHLEAKTAVLCKVLAAGGAEMFITGSNPLSTQDDIAAALVESGLNVYAWYNATEQEYQDHIQNVIINKPNIIIDDGGDLVNLVHDKYPNLIENIIGGCEETTTGIIRLRSMEKRGLLKFPMIAVNNAKCKYLFDNRYGTGQSVWDGINRTTNLIVAGKKVVVCGYGWCGKGVAMRAKGFGGNVVITEVDPVKAIEAIMDGFTVLPMEEAAKVGDIFITVTGCKSVITIEHMQTMKDGAVLCNAGHFNVEIEVEKLSESALNIRKEKNNIIGYQMENNHWIYILAEGRLVNLAAGDGHPVEIMDMSFAIQALSAEYLAKNRGKFSNEVITVPEEIDHTVALKKLGYWGVKIDMLSDDQKKYLDNWNVE